MAFVGLGMSFGALAIGAVTLFLRRRRSLSDGVGGGRKDQTASRSHKVKNKKQLLPVDDPDAREDNDEDLIDEDDIIGDDTEKGQTVPKTHVPQKAAAIDEESMD